MTSVLDLVSYCCRPEFSVVIFPVLH